MLIIRNNVESTQLCFGNCCDSKLKQGFTYVCVTLGLKTQPSRPSIGVMVASPAPFPTLGWRWPSSSVLNPFKIIRDFVQTFSYYLKNLYIYIYTSDKKHKGTCLDLGFPSFYQLALVLVFYRSDRKVTNQKGITHHFWFAKCPVLTPLLIPRGFSGKLHKAL